MKSHLNATAKIDSSDLTQIEVELERLVHSVAKEQKPQRLNFLNEIFKAAVKLAHESPGTLNLKIAATALKELRYSFKLFYPHRFTPKITIFGSARVASDEPLYLLSKRFAEEAVKRKYRIITGGGPGVMAAGNEGAGDQGSFGLNIRLPFEQSANQFIDQKKMLIHYKYFFTRKLFLVKEASALVLFPGGFGTFDEAFEVLTLLQTGKASLIPVVFLEPPDFGFWKAFSRFLDGEMLSRGFISESDRHLYTLKESPEEAMDHIDQFYRVYHSMRFVKDLVVIRLKVPPSEALLTALIQNFSYLSTDGKMHVSKPLPEEENEPELDALPRIVFPFDRRDFGGLRRVVDFLNESAV